MLRTILGVVLGLLALAAPAQPIPAWDFLGEGLRPARLSDCPPHAKLTINFNSGAYSPWSRFCYMGKP